MEFSRTQFYLGHQHTLVASISQDLMKFFVLTAVLAACAVSSLVRSLRLSLQWHYLMAKCSRRVVLSLAIPWNHRQPQHVAPAPTPTIASMAHLVHLIAVMANGMYSIGNWFQISNVVNLNFSMTATSSRALAMVAAEAYSLRADLSMGAWSHTYLTCALNYLLLYEDAHCFSREAGETRWVTAVLFTV